LSVTQIEDQLTQILVQENIESDSNSRHLIAVAADGSLRDALSLLDQAISHGGGVLQEEQVRSMLGTIDSQDLKKLLKILISGDANAVLQHVDAMAEHGPDYDSVLVELLSSLQQIAVCQVLGDETENTSDAIRALAKEISSENIQLYYQMGLMGRRDLALAPDRSEEIKQKDDTKQSTKDIQQDINNNEVTSSDWQAIIDEMALAGLVKELAGHCVLKEHAHDKIHLILTPAQEHLLNTSQKERLHTALKTRFGDQIKMIISVESPQAETPAQKRTREDKELQEAAEKSVRDDATVQAMQDMFDATLDEKSIRPNTN
jgi:DNA polymerase-3 subunit gamma/tau